MTVETSEAVARTAEKPKAAKKWITVDGNEAAARVAHKTNEVAAIFPISPSSPMAELADALSAKGEKNLWGDVPIVLQMQSEAGAAGAAHGSLQAGALTTTFTASQGLLLMIPNMFKIAGELTSTVFHVAARTVATHALSIFGDHSDVMAARSCGWAMLAANNVQEAHDFALIAQAASLRSRLPFIHFFDGFRTSHELHKIEALSDDDMRTLVDFELVRKHRARGMSPDRPDLRGTAQNPDVFFQAREACNPYYLAVPIIVKEVMDLFAAQTGRQYKLFDYVGAPDAERVIILMGSGADAAEETVEALVARGEKVGMIKVRLYRPFANDVFLAALPATARSVAVLDRTKEPGATGEPLYQDVLTALAEDLATGNGRFERMPTLVGGRYGLSSKEFNPAMVKGIFDELSKAKPKNHFTIGIVDDVTHTSLAYDKEYDLEPPDVVRAVFYGLGSDGTVGASKNSASIIASATKMHVQGYFVYDSRKAGAETVSHIRFGPRPIKSTYLIRRAQFVACHAFQFLERKDVLAEAMDGATFLINSPFGPDEVWGRLPIETQQQIIDKKLKVHVINAYRIAREAGLGMRINTVMQTCFFALSNVIPKDQAMEAIKKAIHKSYGRLGEKVVNRNLDAVSRSLENLHEVKVPAKATNPLRRIPPVPATAPDFVQRVTAAIIEGRGDQLPVSALPVDGFFPTGTARFEKRGIADSIPIWDKDLCIQCAKCAIVCPHAAIRTKVFDEKDLEAKPGTFETLPWRGSSGGDFKGKLMRIQVAPDDCTGCGICVEVCPARSKTEVKHKAINMTPRLDHLEVERKNFDFFVDIPEVDRSKADLMNVKGIMQLEPLFEFSSACPGCGETPYLKLLTQFFGDRMVVANATGCTSIYGGNLPTTPWGANKHGRGPAWSNSLFEDNAEFGLGMRLALDQQAAQARRLVEKLAPRVGDNLVRAILTADQTSEAGIHEQRQRVAELKKLVEKVDSEDARELLPVIDDLVKHSVWIIGGDGWAYDIGFGGLDHALASGRDVNILVVDTEVYSNTGGQASKSTPRAAVAKFAQAGKRTGKKDLGMIAMSYGDVYVAQVAMGASDAHTVKAFLEAESWPGPSLILAYSTCVAHGIDMSKGMEHMRDAAASGYWPLYRYDPRRALKGEPPFSLDNQRKKITARDFMQKEARFMMLSRSQPEIAEQLATQAQRDIEERWHLYEQMAKIVPAPMTAPAVSSAAGASTAAPPAPEGEE